MRVNKLASIRTGYILLGTLFISVNSGQLIAQSSEEKIRSVREASNAALKALDEEANMEFLTDDVLIATGAGTLLSGKDELRAHIESVADASPMYWVRTPAEIIVNEERGLAWETGVWHAYSADEPNEKSPVSHGNYAAQWVLLTGEWKIQSQLFVTLN
jgi:ketosteroid isomerase-like protein